jgi:chemotaxis protein CheD
VNERNSPSVINYFLQPGYIYMAVRPAVISTVLGSSVSVCLFDRKRRVGGMNHFLYPSSREAGVSTSIYGNVATLTLIRMMLREGASLGHLEAQILGGAFNPEISPRDIGRENIMAARRVLRRQRIPIVSEDSGGTRGRKIIFTTHQNEIAVLKVERLRASDWYPYENTR